MPSPTCRVGVLGRRNLWCSLGLIPPGQLLGGPLGLLADLESAGHRVVPLEPGGSTGVVRRRSIVSALAGEPVWRLCTSPRRCGRHGGRMLRCLTDILPQCRCHCRVLGRFGPPKKERKESAGPTRPTEPTSEEDLDLGEATAWNRVARWGRWRLTWCQSAMSRVVGWILGRLGSSWP